VEKVLIVKNILIVAECFYPEEFKINDVALFWKSKGYGVDVLTLTPTYPYGKVFKGYKNKLYYRDYYNGINIYRILAVTGYRNSLFKKLLRYLSFMVIGTIYSAFLRKKYDYIFGFNIGSLTSMLPALVVSKIKKIPLTLWVQDLWPDSVYSYGVKKNKLLEFLLDRFVKVVYGSANSIAITSKGFENKIKLLIGENINLHYLPNWPDDIDLSIESYKFNIHRRVNFTFAGNIGKFQNLENIISAFSDLPKKYINKAQLNIIGDGSNLEKLKSINTCKNIIFYGKKPRKDMGKYYKGSDFLIVSLIDEPIFANTVPAKTQTYISACKPILAIIHGETAELIRKNNLGYCAKPNDLKEITQVFIKSIDSDELILSKFRNNSRNLLNNEFDKEKNINLLESILTA
jgi:glycosyltransferase involved in cell wall biosynthesis